MIRVVPCLHFPSRGEVAKQNTSGRYAITVLHVTRPKPGEHNQPLTRLLLGRTVNTAATGRDTVDIQLNNLTTGKLLLQNIARVTVRAFIAKLRRNDGIIAQIEIDITGGKITVRIALANS